MNAYLTDCDFYCEDCAPPGAESYPDGGGEADCPQHCAHCHEPLGNPLTAEGVRYVIEAITESLEADDEDRNQVHPSYDGTYYEGSRHCEIVRDWAEQISSYGGLSPADEWLIGHYLEVTALQPA